MISDFNYFWGCPECGEEILGRIEEGEEKPTKKCPNCGAEMIGMPIIYRNYLKNNPFEGFLKKREEKNKGGV